MFFKFGWGVRSAQYFYPHRHSRALPNHLIRPTTSPAGLWSRPALAVPILPLPCACWPRWERQHQRGSDLPRPLQFETKTAVRCWVRHGKSDACERKLTSTVPPAALCFFACWKLFGNLDTEVLVICEVSRLNMFWEIFGDVHACYQKARVQPAFVLSF